MPDTNHDSPCDESLVTVYWDTLTNYRAALDKKTIEEDFTGRRKLINDFQVKMSELIDLLIESAKHKNADVFHVIGNAYYLGNGVTKNKERAMHWLGKAAEAGNAEAMVSFGLSLRYEGDHGRTNPIEAVEWFRKAAQLGNESGMVFLGFAYRDGNGIAEDVENAAKWFIKAAEKGDVSSMIYVGRVFANELNSPADALYWFLRAIDNGNREIFMELAELYDKADTPIQDSKEAVKWYKKVIEDLADRRERKARAMLALAKHCRDGDGTPRDLVAARDWLNLIIRNKRPSVTEKH